MFRIQLFGGTAVDNIGGAYARLGQAVANAQVLVATTSIQGGRPTGYRIMNESNVVVYETIA